MNNEFIILISSQLISTITIVISIIALFLHLSKKIDNLSNSLNQRIDGVVKENNEIKIEIVKLQNKFDGIETKQVDLEKQVTEVKTETSTRVNQIETENKNYIKELMNKVLEVFPKSAL